MYKNTPIMYSCECGYVSSARYNLKRHQLSKTHQLNMLCKSETLVPNGNGIFTCDACHFHTSRKSNFRNHLLSEKHGLSTKAPNDSARHLTADPVMLVEVMEMFLNHIKDESIQNRQLLHHFALKTPKWQRYLHSFKTPTKWAF